MDHGEPVFTEFAAEARPTSTKAEETLPFYSPLSTENYRKLRHVTFVKNNEVARKHTDFGK